MKSTGRVALAVVFAAMVAAALWLGGVKAQAQNADWEVVRAEYGTRGRRVDVTETVQRLLWEGRQSGRAPVNNQTMGGDPAPGADKSLHIWAHNWRNEEREFDVREGGWIEVANFRVTEIRDRVQEIREQEGRRGRDHDDDDCWCREGREGRGYDERGLRILRAYYGVPAHTANVTEIVRRAVRNGELRIHVDNAELGGDPAPQGDQHVLIVIFRYDGRESAMSVKQGNTMRFP